MAVVPMVISAIILPRFVMLLMLAYDAEAFGRTGTTTCQSLKKCTLSASSIHGENSTN